MALYKYELGLRRTGEVEGKTNTAALTAALDKESAALRVGRHEWAETHVWRVEGEPEPAITAEAVADALYEVLHTTVRQPLVAPHAAAIHALYAHGYAAEAEFAAQNPAFLQFWLETRDTSPTT
jgi:hypothetical protein